MCNKVRPVHNRDADTIALTIVMQAMQIREHVRAVVVQCVFKLGKE